MINVAFFHDFPPPTTHGERHDEKRNEIKNVAEGKIAIFSRWKERKVWKAIFTKIKLLWLNV